MKRVKDLSRLPKELFEETGLDLKEVEGIPLLKRKKKGRDPRGEVESFPFLFYGEGFDKVDVRGMDDALEAEWVPLRKLKRWRLITGLSFAKPLALLG